MHAALVKFCVAFALSLSLSLELRQMAVRCRFMMPAVVRSWPHVAISFSFPSSFLGGPEEAVKAENGATKMRNEE